MTEKVHENNASQSPDSYVEIRIKLPTIKTLVGRVTSKKTSFGKRVGSMLNNAIGKKSYMDETETNRKQNLNDGMAEKERTFRSPRRTAESEEISKRIDMVLERMNVHDDAVSKGVLFETATRCVTFRPVWSMKTMEDEKQNELCKKKILMGMRCRPLGDDENGLLIP